MYLYNENLYKNLPYFKKQKIHNLKLPFFSSQKLYFLTNDKLFFEYLCYTMFRKANLLYLEYIYQIQIF